jgi:glycosyltransferase involved in cell wall biosynthesis
MRPEPFEVTDLLAFIQGEDNIGDQWRIIRPFVRMRQAGIDARYYWGDDHTVLPTDPEHTILVARLMTGTDEATIDRWLEERRRHVRAIVFEADDLMWTPAVVDHLRAADFTQGKTDAELLREGEMSRYFMSRCDGVIVSSEPLAELARGETDRPVICVPNAIDARWFRCQMAARAPWADYPTIGWAGGRRPEADVEPMAVAWGRIARRFPRVRFVVAASLVPDVFYREIEDDSRIIRLPWLSWHDYPVAYQVDIGCCAVSDSPFSRCKTPIKSWEYALAGAAVVATPMLYGADVTDDLTGRLAETADDWEAALFDLLSYEGYRRRLQRNLLERVEDHHTLDGELHRWPEAFAGIVESRQGVAV